MIKEKDLVAVKNGVLGVDDLLEKYPVKSLVTDLVNLVTSKETSLAQPAKIAVTEEELKTITNLFRIKGTSNRGRKKTRID